MYFLFLEGGYNVKVIDLSHAISGDMPVFPGASQPKLTATAERGVNVTMLQLSSHAGTHIDAPYHMIAGAPALDDFAADKFFGLALIIDYPPCAGESIELKGLQQMREKIERAEFVLFNTSHGRKWGTAEYFGPFPVLTREAARYLATFPLKGVGIDAISFDALAEPDNPIHHILLGAGFVLIENLTNFEQVQGEYCMFAALPLKYSKADGSPVRAVAIEMGVKM
jgi:kynurenine formamidase